MNKLKNRWLIAASAVGIHLSIGSVYAWSVYTKPLIAQLGWGLKETQFTFSLAIFFLGMSAAFLGSYVEKLGPKKSGRLAALFFGAGIAGSGLAVYAHSLWGLYLSYGMIGGIGLGLGYITPITSLVKWFPDKKGLATGLAIMGFGFAALISSPLIVYLIDHTSIPVTFFIMGGSYFVVILAASSYIAPPPEGYGGPAKTKEITGMTAKEAIRTKKFWYLWVMFFLNISCGIAIISAASPMAQESAGLSAEAAAAMVGLMGIFNGGGRIGWSAASDWLGRPKTFITFLCIAIASFLILPSVHNPILFQLMIFVIVSCYGAGFSTTTAYVSDLFGTKELGAIVGYMLTAWAAAGMAGPLFAAIARSASSSYNGTLYCFSVLLVVALVFSVLLKRLVNKG
ncbi:L-lactate MFS transporter [Chitinophaga sancti]|uniref:MFS transporter, OFA family, oxalate/formate antiporter n=1 Tax=Chitinophaga sancti TaxID=1004 RepID=A0A1K1S529_9BACT|nr:OFA family MFS transporter [Chitinophaga sancti]WQD63692.1 OFA family MFS transporter [Chitinophaga sancti]WQG90683.1 OFA family MFS transporter [Chitinophaga sancti]SFW79306.1 MFS transporter, OFA family, oxalate/formate antiporter [Chitinophaga sancti]